MAIETKEVTFITHTGEAMIRMQQNDMHTICAAAMALKASHFVVVDDWSVAENLPVWGVFEMRTVEKQLGRWVPRDPIKTFTAEKSDAAVMFAVHTRGR